MPGVLMHILYSNQTSYRVSQKKVEKYLNYVIVELKKAKVKIPKAYGYVAISLVSEAAMKKTNKKFRSKNKVTDILSFSSLDPSSMGELVICYAQIKKQAKEHKLSIEQELMYMLIHGCLHLLGYDHETNERDAKKMFKIQDAIFTRYISSKL